MRELLRCSDRIRMGFLVALLREEGILPIVLDEATSQLLGGAGAVPMRLAVAEADFSRAVALLRAAGEMAE